MKDEIYPFDEDESSRNRLSKLRMEEEKFEKTEKEEKKMDTKR